MDSFSISTVIALIIGVLFTAIGIILLIMTKQSGFRCSNKTKGKIVDIKVEEGEENNIYYSIYEFTINNNVIRKIRKNGSLELNEDIGDEVTIYYNEDNPSDCYAEGEKDNIGLSIALILIGAFSLIIYFLVL